MADLQVKKLAKKAELEDLDRLSQLPEHIHVHILSFLSTEEACRTSVLSKAWRWRWLLADEFDFNTSRLVHQHPLGYTTDYNEVEGPELSVLFFDWVNKALESRRTRVVEASRLHKLRFQYPLDLNTKNKMQVDEWLTYAFVKRVQSLELDMIPYIYHKYMALSGYVPYDFPTRLVAETETDFSFLRSLSLSGVNVSSEDVDLFLSRFRFLQHLKLCRASLLDSLEIGSSSSALKHLELINCGLKSIVVRGTCLESFTSTWVTDLVLENNPNLASVSIIASIKTSFFENHGPQLQLLSSCLSTLQILSLDLNYSTNNEILDQVPRLNELKELTLIIDPELKGSLARLPTLLSLSPKLEKLVLGFVYLSERIGRKKASKKGPFLLRHLKSVELQGYSGNAEAEDKLLKYLFENVVAPLERIIFYPHSVSHDDSRCRPGDRAEISIGDRVERLKEVVEMGAKLFKRAKKKMMMSSSVEYIVKD